MTDSLGNKITLPRLSEDSNLTLKDSPTRIFSQVIDRGTIDPDVSTKPNADPIKNIAKHKIQLYSHFMEIPMSKYNY